MYVTIDNTVQAIQPLLQENLRSPILRRYLHSYQSSHTGTGLQSQSPRTLESDL